MLKTNLCFFRLLGGILTLILLGLCDLKREHLEGFQFQGAGGPRTLLGWPSLEFLPHHPPRKHFTKMCGSCYWLLCAWMSTPGAVYKEKKKKRKERRKREKKRGEGRGREKREGKRAEKDSNCNALFLLFYSSKIIIFLLCRSVFFSFYSLSLSLFFLMCYNPDYCIEVLCFHFQNCALDSKAPHFQFGFRSSL